MRLAPIHKAFSFALLAITGATGAIAPRAQCADAVFNVPELKEVVVVVDGKADEWTGLGLKIDLLRNEKGKFRPAPNFNASFRLAWDKRGLLLLAQVTDDKHVDGPEKLEEIWKGDSLEIFGNTKIGEENVYQVVIAPSGQADVKPRVQISDYRKKLAGKREKLEAQVASVPDGKGGYTLEALLPWKNLNITPEIGLETALQIYVNDTDELNGERFQAVWHPGLDTNSKPGNMYRIKLTADPSPEVKALTEGSWDDKGRGIIAITSDAQYVGKTIKVKDGDKTIGKEKFVAQDGRAHAEIILNKPKDGNYGLLTLTVDEEHMATVEMPPAGK